MSLEDLYIEALGDLDCESYTHRDLCYYLLELIHENLHSKRAQQLLLEVAMAIEEVLGES